MNTDRDDCSTLTVFIISNYIGPTGGGHAVNIYNLARALQKMGVHVEALTLDSPSNCTCKQLRTHFVPGANAFFSLNPGLLEAVLFSLFAAIKLKINEKRFDVVHANGSGAFFYRLIGRKPVVTHIRALRNDYDFELRRTPPEERGFKQLLAGFNARGVFLLEKLSARLSHLVACNSRQTAQAVISECGVEESRTVVVPNGVDQTLFHHLRRTWSSTGSRLLFVARLSHGKFLERIVPLMKSIVDVLPGTTLSVVGSGNAESYLKELARRHRITDRVKFLGRVDYKLLPQYFYQSDLFVYPETPGSTLNQAVSCGLPFVVYLGQREGVPGSLVSEASAAGCGVTTSSPEIFVQEVCRLLRDPSSLATMSDNCREFARTSLDLESIASRLKEHYEALVAHSVRGTHMR